MDLVQLSLLVTCWRSTLFVEDKSPSMAHELDEIDFLIFELEGLGVLVFDAMTRVNW